MNNLVYIVLDSLRYDTFQAAKTPNIDRLAGGAERRYSYASWTSPSHYVYLMGLTPHLNTKGVFASEVYKEDFKKWTMRLGFSNLEFKSFAPELSLPNKLRKMGYYTVAKVSMPVLNERTTFSMYFDEYKLMQNHNDFYGMIEEMEFDASKPRFYFLNLGETHYPYMLQKQDLPRLHGVHGVFKHLDDYLTDYGTKGSGNDEFFSMDQLKKLHKQQIECVEYIDGVMEKLYQKLPANTHLIITSDHGELFGEAGYFGHGPVFHEKAFEVPFIEGKL